MNKSKAKRIGAIIGIIAILSLYLISLLVGIFLSDEYPGLFMASVFSAVIIPIIIYCFIAVYRYVQKKSNPEKYDGTEETDDSNN